MIVNQEPISMAEAKGYLKKVEDREIDISPFLKKFSLLKPKEAKELKAKIEALELIKLRKEHIAKIIDILPNDREELNKVFVNINLDEDETKKILDTIKEFK